MNATVNIQETKTRISFIFHQLTGLQQKTRSTYDKISGLLVYTDTSFGNYTLEMTLINLPSELESIPSFQLYILSGMITLTSILYIIKLKRRQKH
jgi:hypothetical protein